jgi:hypothetical protein
MRNLKFLIAAVSAFLIGIAVTWIGFYFISAMNFPSGAKILPEVEKRFSNIEINFKGLSKCEKECTAEFEVINNSSEPISYSGYSKNTTCAYSFKTYNSKNERLVEYQYCSCGTGLQQITLAPSENTSLEIFVPKKRNYLFEVGFDFQTSNKRQITVWSEDIAKIEAK